MDALNEALKETLLRLSTEHEALIIELKHLKQHFIIVCTENDILKQEKIQLQQENELIMLQYDEMKAQRDDLIDQLHDYESRS